MSQQPEPFTLRVPDEAIADLRDRLARTRFPDPAPGDPWAYGTDVGYLRGLVDYWRDGFDWRGGGGGVHPLPPAKTPPPGGGPPLLHRPGGGAGPPPPLASPRLPGRPPAFP